MRQLGEVWRQSGRWNIQLATGIVRTAIKADAILIALCFTGVVKVAM